MSNTKTIVLELTERELQKLVIGLANSNNMLVEKIKNDTERFPTQEEKLKEIQKLELLQITSLQTKLINKFYDKNY